MAGDHRPQNALGLAFYRNTEIQKNYDQMQTHLAILHFIQHEHTALHPLPEEQPSISRSSYSIPLKSLKSLTRMLQRDKVDLHT